MTGPPPKDPSKRARRNKDTIPSQRLRFVPAEQPALPRKSGAKGWPQRTRDWWAMWHDSAQAELFSATDWDFLLDTALIHAAVWRGDLGFMGELRIRVAKFGATPEDRARLRMTFATADDAEAKAPKQVIDSASRYGDLRVVAAAGE